MMLIRPEGLVPSARRRMELHSAELQPDVAIAALAVDGDAGEPDAVVTP
jgi:hypothetical protein